MARDTPGKGRPDLSGRRGYWILDQRLKLGSKPSHAWTFTRGSRNRGTQINQVDPMNMVTNGKQLALPEQMCSSNASSRGHLAGLCSKKIDRHLYGRFTAAAIAAFLIGLFGFATRLEADATASITNKIERGFSYRHDAVASVPWSIHIVQIDRDATNLELHTSLANGQTIGQTVRRGSLRHQ